MPREAFHESQPDDQHIVGLERLEEKPKLATIQVALEWDRWVCHRFRLWIGEYQVFA